MSLANWIKSYKHGIARLQLKLLARFFFLCFIRGGVFYIGRQAVPQSGCSHLEGPVAQVGITAGYIVLSCLSGVNTMGMHVTYCRQWEQPIFFFLLIKFYISYHFKFVFFFIDLQRSELFQESDIIFLAGPPRATLATKCCNFCTRLIRVKLVVPQMPMP